MDRIYKLRSKKISYICALAHVPPLAAIIMFWHLFSEMGMITLAIIGITFHCLFICIETIAGISTNVNKEEKIWIASNTK